jgi:hypothetical protein
MAFTIKNVMRTGWDRHDELREQWEHLNELADQNSHYWQGRLAKAMRKILADKRLEAIWDSELVPEKSTFQTHAFLAESILRGELDEAYQKLQNGREP